MKTSDAARIANAIHQGKPLPQIGYDGGDYRSETVIVYHGGESHHGLLIWVEGTTFPAAGYRPDLYRVKRSWLERWWRVMAEHDEMWAEKKAMEPLKTEHLVRIVEETA